MRTRPGLRPQRRRYVLVWTVLLLCTTVRVGSQTSDPDTLAEQYEAALAAALAMPEDTEPMAVLQTWGAVFMSAFMAERTRAAAAGVPFPTAEEVNENVFRRWQEADPATGGPDLFRTFSVRDPAAKRARVVALLDRYPDDALIAWQAIVELVQAGELERAHLAAEAFVARHPDRSVSYVVLLQAAGRNETRSADAMLRWSRAVPGDPALVGRWLGSNLARQEPEATERLVDALLARSPTGDQGLSACLAVLRRGSPGDRSAARACVARIAGDPESTDATAQRATAAMAESAAADGDWSAVIAALDSLDPAARSRALVATARRLESPDRCDESTALLTAAFESEVRDEPAIAAALRGCAERPSARALFSNLLARTPSDRIARVVRGWVTKVNGVLRGSLPDDAGTILEERILERPASGLFEALDLVYRLAGDEHPRLDGLRRWYALAPDDLDKEQITALAAAVATAGESAAAKGLLERHLEAHFDHTVAEALWQLTLETEGLEAATRFAVLLAEATEAWRARSGHALAARSAVLRGDPAAAERHYWQALDGDHPPRDLALELLWLVGRRDDGGSSAATAERLCEERGLAKNPEAVPGCAAALLAEVGDRDAARFFLAAPSADLPEDPEALRTMAATAITAGQLDVAERALRRRLEIDPRNENAWTDLGLALEKRGDFEALLTLLDQARERFAPPPSFLYRATGRALTAGGRWRPAIEVFLEAREVAPETAGGDWSRGWIDHELRQAYRGLGQPILDTKAAPAPGDDLDTLRSASDDGDVDAMVAFARLTLTFDGTGALCSEGLRRLTQAADAGQAEAAAFLGKLLFYGRGDCVAHDPRSAIPWLQAGAEAGRPGAPYDLAMALMFAGEDATARRRGRDVLIAAADDHDVLAVETLTFLAATGVALPRDLEMAARRLAQAARLGSDGLPGMRNAASISDRFARLVETGLRSLETAAANDDMGAMAWWARLRTVGMGDGDLDRQVTLARARRAAEAGESLAMRVLSQSSAWAGDQALADDERRAWRRRCAEAGNSFCMMFLGNALLEGEDVERDVEAGLKWLRRAGEAGNYWAVAALGRLYAGGRYGVAEDLEEAVRWKRLGAAAGDPEAVGWLRFHGDD